jgi:recombination endonuclease VII
VSTRVCNGCGLAKDGKKRCSRCKETKTVEEFHKNKSTKDGYQVYCSNCQLLARAESYARNPTATRASNRRHKIKRVFRITQEEYDKLGAKSNVCPICGFIGKLHLDHDHSTGNLREFICGNCNRALGILKEDTERMEKLIAYVKKHKKSATCSESTKEVSNERQLDSVSV